MAKESQPVALVNVFVKVPALLHVIPFQLNGSWLGQILMESILVELFFTINTNVNNESQPAALIKVFVKVPALLQVIPFQLYGSWLGQILMVSILLELFFTINTNVSNESQPAALIKVFVKVPALLQVIPFQLYGSWLGQILMVSILLELFFTINTNVSNESQPAALINVFVKVPALLHVIPFQLYGN